MISSLQNPKVKAVTRLHQRKYREEESLILIEGRHPIEEAFETGVTLKEIYLRENEKAFLDIECPQIPVFEHVMAKMSTTDNPLSAIAVASMPEYLPIKNLLQRDTLFALGLAGIQDPGNFGTLIRSATAFGFTSVLLAGAHMDPFNPKVIRASAGMLFRLSFTELSSIADLIVELENIPDLQLWGTNPKEGESYREVNYSDRVMLMLGGEPHGLPRDILQAVKPLRIPMSSAAESLNVAVAGSIIMAEVYQQRITATSEA